MANISTIKVGNTSYGITATPTAHASTATTYGAASASNYGHVKLSDNYKSSAGTAASGIGASSAAVYNAYNTLNSILNKSMFGTGIDISDYTQSNPYIAPSDGYLRPNSWLDATRPYYINGLASESPAKTSMFIFVKKGFKLWGDGHIDGTNLGFYPLV